MRILLLNKYHYRKGGAERAYFDMAAIFTEAGHEVAFFSMEHPQNEATYWSKYFVSNVDYQNDSYSWLQRIRTAFKIIWNREANKKLAALIDEFRPDIAHAHNIYHQLSPSIFHTLKKKGVPIVMTLHDYKLVSPNYNLYSQGNIWEHHSGLRCLVDRCIQGSFSKSFVCGMEKWIHDLLRSYHLVDLLISPSRFLAEKVVALGWNGSTIRILPNPLRREELERPVAPRAFIKNRLVFFGRLSEEKGIGQVLFALAAVSEKELIIIGEGPLKENLRSLTEELHIAERVQFIGHLQGEELREELQKAEAVIVPSVWYENLPYAVTESLSLGLIVIAAASGGIPERIAHRKNGFLYNLHDTKGLIAILKDLDSHDLEAIRRRAKASVSDLHPYVFKEKLLAFYKSLL